MVTYRSITIELRSQYDLLALPEFAPPPTANDSIRLKDDENARISVFVPVYPSSQFWICYSIAPPHPPSSYFYFKLFIDGVHIISWGCGQEDNYRGKTMYALFNNGLNKKTATKKCRDLKMEKRSFFFPTGSKHQDKDLEEDLEARLVEIKAYRSNARRRISKNIDNFSGNSTAQQVSENIRLLKSGEVGQGHPQRFYQYALVDPVEHPFAAFRYFYRTRDELHDMGLTDSRYRSMSTISEESTSSSHSSYKTAAEERQENESGTIHTNPRVPMEAASASNSTTSPTATTTPYVPQSRRLSFPPSVQLLPSGQLPLQIPLVSSNLDRDSQPNVTWVSTDQTNKMEEDEIRTHPSSHDRERSGRLRLFRSITKGRDKVSK